MVRCALATSIEEEQPWSTLPGWTCRWKRPPSVSSMTRGGSFARRALPASRRRWWRSDREETAICIVDDAGRIVREARAASEPETLVAFFRASGMVMRRVGLEACSLTAWLHQGLTAAGIAAICIEARQAKAAMGAMPNKTDRNDARGIAQIMRTGWYRAVHVKSPSCRSWRALLTARRMVLNKRRDVENGIRALLREVGLKVGTPSRKAFSARVRELAAGDPVLASLAES